MMEMETIDDRIISTLGHISLEKNVDILYACESGSRAWGFASNDSDYDVRYIYSHPEEWYLTIDACQKRDVIDGAVGDFFGAPLDFVGWDLRKALQLFRKGNPPLLEWLNSPIVYVDKQELARVLRSFSVTYINPAQMKLHYLHMAFNNWKKYLQGDAVMLKKYLYVLRPLCAVRRIEMSGGLPAVNFSHLLQTIHLPANVRAAIEDLVERKRAGEELGIAEPIPLLDEWITEEFAKPNPERGRGAPDPIDDLNTLFGEILEDTR